ncbi:DUF2380 domain-containing protein [Myxococcaceae bacterium JPH2]|nr:DUF2380 domain-containing protein [Myxococcaceae bacterium JPH2]
MERVAALSVGVLLLLTGCASVAPERGQTLHLDALPHTADASERLTRRREAREDEAGAGSAVGGARASVAQTRRAVLDAVDEVKGSTRGIANSLSRLAARKQGIGGANGVFTRYVDSGANQLRWLSGTVAGTTALAETAGGVADEDMELGILRMTGPRLQAAMFGAILLATWTDFLGLADVTLEQVPSYSAERLFVDMSRVQRLMEPTLTALASQDPEQAEAAATAMPALMGKLTREFASIREGVRLSGERSGQVMAAAQVLEMVTLVSALKLSLPRLPPPPAAPVTLGVALVMGANGVMTGSQLVVSAEWVEMIRRLVQAGVISLPAVSAAVRIHAGHVLMAQGNGELPQGVRDALGDSPEVRGMQVRGRAGAGMSDAPKHHVLPNEYREWFEQRGFKGAMDIDQFCVRLEQAQHEALHGGGNWKLGRTWPGEWNRMIMETLREAEVEAGRRLTRNEILKEVAKHMRDYQIPMSFTPGAGR